MPTPKELAQARMLSIIAIAGAVKRFYKKRDQPFVFAIENGDPEQYSLFCHLGRVDTRGVDCQVKCEEKLLQDTDKMELLKLQDSAKSALKFIKDRISKKSGKRKNDLEKAFDITREELQEAILSAKIKGVSVIDLAVTIEDGELSSALAKIIGQKEFDRITNQNTETVDSGEEADVESGAESESGGARAASQPLDVPPGRHIKSPNSSPTTPSSLRKVTTFRDGRLVNELQGGGSL